MLRQRVRMKLIIFLKRMFVERMTKNVRTKPSGHNQGKYSKRTTRVKPDVGVAVRLDDELLITIKRLGINGEGIGYYKRKITFIPGALPGEVVEVRVKKVADHYIEANLLKIKKASPERVTPEDDQSVGGAELAHLAYPAQLVFKQDVIRQALEKYRPAGYRDYVLKPTLGMDEPRAYRNKAQFPIRKVNGKLAVGMYRRQSHHLVDLPKISTQHPATLHVVRTVRDIIAQLGIPVFNEKTHQGDIKTLIARVSESTGDVQLTLVTNSHQLPQERALFKAIHERLPEVVSIHQNINPGTGSLIWGDDTRFLWGAEYITEEINGKHFKLSPRAFFQLNPKQTERLYQEALVALDLTHADNLIDAYSGVGTLGLSVAGQAGEVRGMDTIPEAIDDAIENAQANGITNAHYYVGQAEQLIPAWQAEGWQADALIVDPPRTGLDTSLRKLIVKTRPAKFVYISCNASTLARDLVDLAKVYRVDYIQSIDMFPQTARWEGIVKFTLK